MKNRINFRGFAPIIILILLVLLVLVVGWVHNNIEVGKNKLAHDMLTSTPVASAQPSSVPTAKLAAGPTANWKTYSNPGIDITFRYPPGWEVRLAEGGGFLLQKNDGADTNFYIVLSDYSKFDNESEARRVAGSSDSKVITNGVSMSVGGKVAIQQTLYVKSVKLYQLATYFSSENTSYIFSGYSKDSGNLDTNRKIYDQILTTVSFTK